MKYFELLSSDFYSYYSCLNHQYFSDCDDGVECQPAGMCVMANNVCDEVPNCSDSTDETNQRCVCKYGEVSVCACVHGIKGRFK